ncbi:MAG TPA: hypothetical protein VGC90_08750 [Candidatus Limnocylindrales bacterium]
MPGADDPASIPFILCFDVEPDEIDVQLGPRPWLGFERLVERVADLRAQLSDTTGRPARLNWFLRMDPQIAVSHGAPGWAADRYGDALEALRAAGDEIGVHPHAWRHVGGAARWVADHGDAEWVDACIRMSFEAYELAFGRPCRSVRFGDRFFSSRAIALAASLGARHDLTLEPGSPAMARMHRAPATGRIPSMMGVPRYAYTALAADPLRPRPSSTTGPGVAIRMIPLTSLNPDPILPAWRRLARRVRHPGRDLHRPAGLFAEAWPPGRFWASVEAELEAAERPYLAFAVRSDVPLHAGLNAAFEDKLAALLRRPLVKRLSFTTPDAVPVLPREP